MSAQKLHADQLDTDVDLVRQLLASQFPQWADLPIAPVPSDGTENAIYRLGDDTAARLPLRPVKDDQIDKLDRWLPVLAPHLPLAIPEPLAKGAPGEGYPVTWSVVRWLAGEEATFERLADPVREARRLGEFVRALVAIDPTGGPPPGEHNFWRGVALADRDQLTRRCIAQCDGLIDVDAVTEAWERDLNAPVWDKPPTWLHGDLASDNMLAVDGQISAVIDWGGLAVGDPATELQPAWNLFRGESRDAYREATGVDDATWARGRGLALSVSVVALPYYKDTLPGRAKGATYIMKEALKDHGYS